jgi:pimeloyl-ACP methyl ester carboxylesterase
MIPPLETAELGVVVYDFPFNRDLEETAAAFERDWVRFRTQQGDTRPWSIVAHSMGALLARSYVEGDTYQKDVDHLILLGPVNQGSWLAQAQGLLQLVEGLQAVNQRTSTTLAHLGDGLGAAADDLLPGSRFLTELNRRSRREGVRYHILAGSAGFLTAETRARLDAQFRAVARPSSLLNGIARLTLRDLGPRLDELTEGTGDGCVSVASTRLAGVEDHVVIPANHVELIRGPLLYPEPGPVVSLPFILQWLGIETPR